MKSEPLSYNFNIITSSIFGTKQLNGFKVTHYQSTKLPSSEIEIVAEIFLNYQHFSTERELTISQIFIYLNPLNCGAWWFRK
jgi:hypothetical protein